MHSPVHVANALIGAPKECRDLKLSKTDCRKETWKALSELVEQGIVRNVGVSNFAADQLRELTEMDGVAPVANNQIQFNPWLLPVWVEAAEFCHDNGIAITGYNTLGGSLQHHETKDINTLTDLAEKHNRSVAQILLRWALQNKVVVIPGTGNPNYMKENLSIYSFELSPDDMESIAQLQTSNEMKKFLAAPKFE